MIKKCLLLALFTFAAPALASTFLVSINTSAISGMSGSLFFSFGPGAPPFDSATATVSGFTGGTLGAGLLPPGPGILPGTLVLDNSSPALYQQAITYGSQIKFFLALTGPAIVSPSPGAVGGSDFALFLLDGMDNPLLTDDPNGSILDASIAAKTGAVSFATFTNNEGPTVATVTPLPEPGTVLLLLSGVVMLGARRYRRFNLRRAISSS